MSIPIKLYATFVPYVFYANTIFIDFERLVEMEEYCLYKRLLISPIMLTGKISVYSIKDAVTHEVTVYFFVVKKMWVIAIAFVAPIGTIDETNLRT